jgi:hypothetical protein
MIDGRIPRGSDVPDLTDSVEFQRGGFWRRALAAFIDLIAISVMLQLAALALFPATHGRVQFSGGLIYTNNCQPLPAVPEELSFPAEFGANTIIDCQHGLFGLTSSRILTVARITRDGTVTKTLRVGYMLDAEGKPIRGLPLDILMLPLLLALRFALDHFGGSPGRRICRLRLATPADGRFPPPAAVVNRRYGWLALSLVPSSIWSVYAALFPGPELLTSWFYLACWIGASIPAVVSIIAAAVAMIRRRDAWYDRLAHTAVLRLSADRTAIPLAPAAPPREGDPLYPQQAMPEGVGAMPPPLPQAPPVSRNYFLRHWRGELSLPVTYWLNGTLGGLATGIAIGLLAYFTYRQGEAQPLVWLLSMIATWLIAALFLLWQGVGIWRSAIRYRRGGKYFWGGAAQAAIVLGALQFVFGLASVGVPQLAGIYEIVTGDARVGPHQFYILANGQTLEFYGGITFGVADEFERFLGAMGNVRTVRLYSNGGRILEAQKISDIIRRRNLATFVARDCLSACTIVFLGGTRRFMLPTARLGFHQPAFRGMTISDRNVAIANEEARLQRLGLSRAFAVKANEAPPNSMWFPDNDELLREHVITALVPPQQIAPSPTDRIGTGLPPSIDGNGNDPPAFVPRPAAVTTTAVPVGRPAGSTMPATVRTMPIFPPVVAAPGPSTVTTTVPAVPPAGAPPAAAATAAAAPPAKIPTDLLKRLTAPPKKPVVMPAQPPPAPAPAAK